MTIITVIILAGMAVGFYQRNNNGFLRAADKGATASVYCLLFVLGAGLGADKTLLARLPVLGSKALGITVCVSLGSVLCLRFAEKTLAVRPPRDEAPKPAVHMPSPLWGTLRILFFFMTGAILGAMGWLPAWVYSGNFALYALWGMVLAVGIGLGGEIKAFRIVRDMHIKILIVPGLVIVGTVLGAVFASLVLPDVSLRDALAVGAGFGYYSLSSVLIEQAGNSALATIALLSNILRELMGIFTAPLFVRVFGPLAPVAVAGSTAMDTCLPAIARFSGERCAILAVFSGMVLSLLVPFFVGLIMRW